MDDNKKQSQENNEANKLNMDDMAQVSGGDSMERDVSWTPCPVCLSENVELVEFSDILGSLYRCCKCGEWYLANGRAACPIDRNWLHYDPDQKRFYR